MIDASQDILLVSSLSATTWRRLSLPVRPYVQAASRDSYPPYFNARRVLKEKIRQNADILDEGALPNTKTMFHSALL